jgi:hypothetical protein
MEKQLVVNLSRGNADDVVTYTEDGEEKSRIGLLKVVDGEYKNNTFDNLVNYMLEPSGDEFNNEYSRDEKELSEVIRKIRNEDCSIY